MVNETRGMNTYGHGSKPMVLWMDKILHQIETMGNNCLLVFTGESASQGFVGGAGFRPSTVPFWDKCTTHFSLLWWGWGCSLGVGGSDPWP